ncbi:glycosyltransferase family 2 protein [Pedobacter sp. MC2016-15]|uniref:glycosyltransferase family 2 protein n=1 Tax=Pedobacter sp. MC2016-15 TaxID=2994473 RepID=UPI0022455F83|nr:glycosyltransferase family 2 protein [Pedobacter sp. MC2016-15]MCX2478342.1 glycosyltransferase family 2 protein [Pedobacter sp. MC2016-15]
MPKLVPNNVFYEEKISILIPVRNEEHNIIHLLESIQSQDCRNYEVLVLNDNSTDNTLKLAQSYAKSKSNIRVINGMPLQKGWTGKNFACWQLAQEASGKYFLFIDADVSFESGLLGSAIAHMKRNQLSLLSLFPDQQMKTIGEKRVIPLMNYLLLTLLPLKLIFGNSNPVFAAACGQFMLFDAALYKKHQWHARVRKEVTEDIKIMRLLKTEGEAGDSLMANGLFSCRMYSSYRDAIDGFSKNFITPFNDSIPLFILFLSCVLGGPLVVFATMNLYLIVALCTIIILTRLMTSSLSGQKGLVNACLHPLQMLSLLHIGYLAVHRTSTKTIGWKGRIINS